MTTATAEVTMPRPDPERKRVRSVNRAIDILTCFSEAHPRLTLAELADASGLPKASAYRIATSLIDHGLIRRSEPGVYMLGARLIELGTVAANTLTINQVAAPVVSMLYERTGETVLVADINWSDQTLMIVDRRDSRLHMLTVLSPVGRRSMVANGCIGKAVLAALPEDELHDLLPKLRLSARTSRSIVDKQAFLDELALCRSRGFAIATEEFMPGVIGISVPVVRDDRPVGAVAVIAPSVRWSEQHLESVGKLMKDLVRRS